MFTALAPSSQMSAGSFAVIGQICLPGEFRGFYLRRGGAVCLAHHTLVPNFSCSSSDLVDESLVLIERRMTWRLTETHLSNNVQVCSDSFMNQPIGEQCPFRVVM